MAMASKERREAEAERKTLPSPPDSTAVNTTWRAEPTTVPAGVKGLLYRLLDRLLAPRFAPQREFNARQVELDNDVLRFLDARFAATHENYDRVLGSLGRRLDEIDERHRHIEAALQAHARDIRERVDLALEQATRGGLARDFALEELRTRLLQVEEALGRREE
jgi:hypothetical protein